MQVAEIMNRTNLTEAPSATLREAASRMWKQQTGSLVIVEGAEILGIITERDIMKSVARGDDLDATPVSAVMTRTVLTVAPDTSIAEAAQHMADRWIRHLPVVSEGELLGMLSQRDLCAVLARTGESAS